MGLAHRVIPTILCRGRQMVKGKQFNAWRSVGLASQAVRIHAMRGVDEVCLLDIGATPEGRGPDLALVEELSEVLFTPLAVGGGIRTVEQVRDLLRAGADKVVIGTAAWEERKPSLIRELADVVGSQAIVAALDCVGDEFAVRCGKKHIHVNATTAAHVYASEGVGEILLTSIAQEGTMRGYDLDLVRKVREVVHCPVIAHGGCSGYEDMAAAIRAGANAVAAGALFQFTEATPRGAAEYLQSQGIEARV